MAHGSRLRASNPMRLTFLGTGTSFGVPQVGCDCAVCRSTDPRDKRTRCSVAIESNGRTILIDTAPELRLQLLTNRITQIDAVLYTHAHADHVNGIDDLRIFTAQGTTPVLPCYGPVEALEQLDRGFRYIFDDVQPYSGTSKPRLSLVPLEAGQVVEIAGMPVLPLAFEHGYVRVFGYRVGRIAYITDAKAIPEAARAQLRDLDLLVLNALWHRPHPTHLSIEEAVETARAIGARQTYFTHLTHETGHAELAASLPPGIAPAYDGLTHEVSA
jgi:phosphoribosyl 1,2-cyclic phosphate phosphodiesterase